MTAQASIETFRELLERVQRLWEQFFFHEESPIPIALFRVALALLVIADLLLRRPDWLTWYGEHGIVSLHTIRAAHAGSRLDISRLLLSVDTLTKLCWWGFLFAALFLLVGLFTRTSSIAVFLALLSTAQRDPYVLNGGDTVLRLCSFFLMFAPAGAALSADRLIRVYRGLEGPHPRRYPPWATRLIQIQVALLYLSTFCWKLTGQTWRDGTAVYYALHLTEFQRYPIPFRDSLLFSRIATWGTLLVEFSLGSFIWMEEYRMYVLLAGILLHLAIDYSMALQLFEWIMIATYIVFLTPKSLESFWEKVQTLAGHYLAAKTATFQPGSRHSLRIANLLQALDVFRRLRINTATALPSPAATASLTGDQWSVLTRTKAYTGFWALLELSDVLPLLWPLLPARLVAAACERGK